MTRSIRSSIGLAGLLALALTASAGAAQAQQSDPCSRRSNDPADFNDELRRDCGPITYEVPNLDPRNQRTVVMTPHQADYSSFPMTSLARFFDGLSYEEKARVVRIAAQRGVTDSDNRPMSVEDFGALTDFLDSKMDHGGFSPDDKRQFLGQLAAEAHVYGNGRDRTAGQDFGGGGPRYDYEATTPPRR